MHSSTQRLYLYFPVPEMLGERVRCPYSYRDLVDRKTQAQNEQGNSRGL